MNKKILIQFFLILTILIAFFIFYKLFFTFSFKELENIENNQWKIKI